MLVFTQTIKNLEFAMRGNLPTTALKFFCIMSFGLPLHAKTCTRDTHAVIAVLADVRGTRCCVREMRYHGRGMRC